MTTGRFTLTRDARLLFAARTIRLFAYGFVSVVLVLYLSAIRIDEHRIGLLLTLTLVGDVAISLYLTTRADLIGRRRTLLAGAALMILAAAVFASTREFIWLVIAATIGVISPSGNEVGPFLAVEQIALAQTAPSEHRTGLFAWYNLVGSFATAIGSLCAGFLANAMMGRGYSAAASYRSPILGYGVLGVALLVLFSRMSPKIEAPAAAVPARKNFFHIEKSRGVVARLSGLFVIDAFAGGLVVQSIVAYWFYRRFGLSPSILGSIFFGANIFAGISSLLAVRIAKRFGLLNTMVFTHLPSNVLLILVPLMPTLGLAIAVLLARFSISQMDVPTRQSYVYAVVDDSERTAAAGITGVARTTGAALAPLLAMPLVAANSTQALPFIIAGGLKIVYDLILLRAFSRTAHLKS